MPPKSLGEFEALIEGLPAEDEFGVICAWLGRCRLIHKLDQQEAPVSSRDIYQVADLLAAFDTAGPFLIEVKAKQDRTLSVRPDYFGGLVDASLRSFAPPNSHSAQSLVGSQVLPSAQGWIGNRPLKS
jgi:hypothetical protein